MNEYFTRYSGWLVKKNEKTKNVAKKMGKRKNQPKKKRKRKMCQKWENEKCCQKNEKHWRRKKNEKKLQSRISFFLSKINLSNFLRLLLTWFRCIWRSSRKFRPLLMKLYTKVSFRHFSFQIERNFQNKLTHLWSKKIEILQFREKVLKEM